MVSGGTISVLLGITADPVDDQAVDGTAGDHQIEVGGREIGDDGFRTLDRDVELNEPLTGPFDEADLLGAPRGVYGLLARDLGSGQEQRQQQRNDGETFDHFHHDARQGQLGVKTLVGQADRTFAAAGMPLVEGRGKTTASEPGSAAGRLDSSDRKTPCFRLILYLTLKYVWR